MSSAQDPGNDTSVFTEAEKDSILRLLGYPNWAALAQSIQLGYPAASQPLFLVFDAFHRIRPEARARVRTDLCRALGVECQMAESRTRLKASRVGEVTLNATEFTQLTEQLRFWTLRVADQLGVVPNPYSQVEYQGATSAGGVNARIIG
jgi:hypothetical protein